MILVGGTRGMSPEHPQKNTLKVKIPFASWFSLHPPPTIQIKNLRSCLHLLEDDFNKFKIVEDILNNKKVPPQILDLKASWVEAYLSILPSFLLFSLGLGRSKVLVLRFGPKKKVKT